VFEIYKRHTPMFVTSEVKRLAETLTRAMGFEEFGIEISPVFHTVRINETNQFIVREPVPDEKLKALRTKGDLLESVLRHLASDLGVDSYFCLGEPKIFSSLKPVTESSRNPLVVFNGRDAFRAPIDEKWLDKDLPALWLEGSLVPEMKETEAYFAISPTLKLEVALNRFQTLESFGSFALGLVRF